MSTTTYTPKVGDRVRLTSDIFRADGPQVGTEGTITEIILDYFLFVDMDGYPLPSDDPEGGDGYPVTLAEVEPVEQAA